MTIEANSLEPGEQLLWQGEPSARMFSSRTTLVGARIGFGLLILGVALAVLGQSPEYYQFSGVLFVVAVFLLCRPLWVQRDLHRTRYALTDRRAIIERRGILLRNRASVPFSQIRRIEVRDETFGDLIFKDYIVQTENGMQNTRGGFYAIPDVQTVAQLLRAQVDRTRGTPNEGGFR